MEVHLITNACKIVPSRLCALFGCLGVGSQKTQLLFLITMKHYTVVSEKKGTIICEIVMERYIYLRNTQKQLQTTNYVRNRSFLEFYLVYNGVCLKLLGSLL